MLILCANSFFQFWMFPFFASSSDSEACLEIDLSVATLTSFRDSLDIRARVSFVMMGSHAVQVILRGTLLTILLSPVASRPLRLFLLLTSTKYQWVFKCRVVLCQETAPGTFA